MGVLMNDPNKIGYWSRDKDRVRVRHAIQFRLRDLAESVEGECLFECPAGAIEDALPPWRVLGINLTNVRVQPKMGQPDAGRQPGPGLGGPGLDQ
jgi:hypothetical protein